MHMDFRPAITKQFISDSVFHQNQYKRQKYIKQLLEGTGDQLVQADPDGGMSPKIKEAEQGELHIRPGFLSRLSNDSIGEENQKSRIV